MMKNGPLVILLVEDDPDHSEIILRLLQEHPAANKVFHVSDGEAALDYLFRHGECADPAECPIPHLILLDLRLPKIDGLEVLRKIKTTENLRFIPVVVLTSSEADADIAMAYHHHVNSYLVKPMDFIKFTKIIENLGFYWLVWNRQPRS